MKQFFIRKNDTDTLNLIFLGYGQDEHPYLNLQSQSDTAIVYDYEDGSFDESIYKSYQKINLIAWSMGVMIAPVVLSESSLKDRIVSSYALNGTKEGIDEQYGISPAMWQATAEALSEKSILKFYRRMCLNNQDYEEYLASNICRSVESMYKELNFIAAIAADTDKKSKASQNFCYNQALIGSKDRIFSKESMLLSFEKTSAKVVTGDFAHYSKEVLTSLLV